METTLTQKISNLLKNTTLSISHIARESELSRNYLYKIINNDIYSVSYENAKKICDVLGEDIAKLMGIEGDKKAGIKIPVLGVIPAGVPIEAVENVLGYEEIDSKLASTGSFFALKVQGDSMAPQILENDIVIIKQQEDADSGDVCVVIVNGYDATLKRIKKDGTGLWLIPNNSAYQSEFYPASDVVSLPIKIIGKAIEIRRSL